MRTGWKRIRRCARDGLPPGACARRMRTPRPDERPGPDRTPTGTPCEDAAIILVAIDLVPTECMPVQRRDGKPSDLPKEAGVIPVAAMKHRSLTQAAAARKAV